MDFLWFRLVKLFGNMVMVWFFSLVNTFTNVHWLAERFWQWIGWQLAVNFICNRQVSLFSQMEAQCACIMFIMLRLLFFCLKWLVGCFLILHAFLERVQFLCVDMSRIFFWRSEQFLFQSCFARSFFYKLNVAYRFFRLSFSYKKTDRKGLPLLEGIYSIQKRYTTVISWADGG